MATPSQEPPVPIIAGVRPNAWPTRTLVPPRADLHAPMSARDVAEACALGTSRRLPTRATKPSSRRRGTGPRTHFAVRQIRTPDPCAGQVLSGRMTTRRNLRYHVLTGGRRREARRRGQRRKNERGRWGRGEVGGGEKAGTSGANAGVERQRGGGAGGGGWGKRLPR